MPFIDVVTGWEVVEYMATGDGTAAGSSGEEKRGWGCAPESVAAARWRVANSSGRAGGGRRAAEEVAADYSLLLRLSFVFEDWLDSTGLDLDWTGNGALGCRMQGKARMVEEKL